MATKNQQKDVVAALAAAIDTKLRDAQKFKPEKLAVSHPSSFSTVSAVRVKAHKNKNGEDIPEMSHAEFRHAGKTLTVRSERDRQALLYLLNAPRTMQALIDVGAACITLNPMQTQAGAEEPEVDSQMYGFD